MDPRHFDRLAKFAARRPSRRKVLGVLGGGLLTAFGGGAGAAPRGRDQPCETDQGCPGGHCVHGRCVGGGGPEACPDCCDRCSDRPAVYRERFSSCFNNKAFCEGHGSLSCCAFCTGWLGCAGTLDTQTSCGTVTHAGCG